MATRARLLSPFAALVLGGCAPAAADLDFVAVSGPAVTLDAARAEVDAFVLGDCAGGTVTVDVGDTVDLLAPRPFAVRDGDYCDIAVSFSPDPFDGALHLAGRTAAGTPFDIALDPGLAVLTAPFTYDGDEGVLVLDAGVLLDAAALDAAGPDVVIRPDDAAGEALADTVPDALWFGTPAEADAVWLDLWPFDAVDFEVRAGSPGDGGRGGDGNVGGGDVAGRGGCAGPSGGGEGGSGGEGDADTDVDADTDADADTDTDTDTDTDADSDADTDADADGGTSGGGTSGGGTSGGGTASGRGGCGGEGSGGDGSGGGCDGGGSGGSSGGTGGGSCGGSGGGGSCAGAACSASGLVPPGWAALLAVLAVRRRRT